MRGSNADSRSACLPCLESRIRRFVKRGRLFRRRYGTLRTDTGFQGENHCRSPPRPSRFFHNEKRAFCSVEGRERENRGVARGEERGILWQKRGGETSSFPVFCPFLSKPFSPPSFYRSVRRLLRSVGAKLTSDQLFLL